MVTHGTCGRLTPADYFEEATEAFHEIKVPAEYQRLATQLSVSPDEVRNKFAAANPGLGDQGFVVTCSEPQLVLTQEALAVGIFPLA